MEIRVVLGIAVGTTVRCINNKIGGTELVTGRLEGV